MRPGQSNKRSRGRGRKGPSPLSRSYESNGPDVKIRGTAQHVADKYINLARDAQSSGDTVLSEAYYQHAEHFYRIVAAAQQQMNQPVNVRRADDPIDASENEEEEEKEGFDPSDPDAPQPDLRNQANGRNGPRSEEDGERRNRRNRSRGRRGREDFRADEANAEQRPSDGSNGAANGSASDGGGPVSQESEGGQVASNGSDSEVVSAAAEEAPRAENATPPETPSATVEVASEPKVSGEASDA